VINAESVSAVHPTPPGYAVGTMLDLSFASETVKEEKKNEAGEDGHLEVA
jgi:hypothetical protein